MYRKQGKGKLTHSIPHPFNDTRKLLFLNFDANHIINFRSLFLENDMTDGKEIISGKYVKMLYELQKKENIKPIRNLTHKHINPTTNF